MRYIEIDSIIEQIKAEHCERCTNHRCALCDIDKVLLKLEEADDDDVEEVKHGEWLVNTFQMCGSISLGSSIKCSECGHREVRGSAWNIDWGIFKYCPNCGAKMDGERKEK